MTESDLLAFLDREGIAYTLHRHPPLHTVEESRELRGDLPGAHCKNMFLKSKAGEMVLVTCEEGRSIRIRDLEKRIGLRKLSFAKPDLLLDRLGVTPGAVTPLAILNDTEGTVRVVLDEQMMRAEVLNCHPLHNEATVAISTADLARIFDLSGHAAELVDFDELERAAVEAPGK
ncbi:prolyl-tRNA synthetase associated domain-containing protein [Roseobacter sp. HKCCA0434]|uniref:prolyl-tRNA synthetase associated domain-containing protein n=1 Tax=Roseobacter sp. HKCCA0434 TaxID=3079297 RepID=UPI002905B227|nr:prolyl-tRNA synthetase associated domain-containing protein [Roseobacter sp. HKCCA0434]